MQGFEAGLGFPKSVGVGQLRASFAAGPGDVTTAAAGGLSTVVRPQTVSYKLVSPDMETITDSEARHYTYVEREYDARLTLNDVIGAGDFMEVELLWPTN